MASLKLLSALKVSTCSGIAELDDFVSNVRLFASGDSLDAPDGILDYQDFATCALGYRFYSNENNTFFLNKDYALEGPSDMWEGGMLVSRTWYRNGDKHGLETKWWCPTTKRTEGRWRNGKRVGEHTKWNRDGWPSETEVYSEEGECVMLVVYSLSERGKVAHTMLINQLE